MTERVNQVLHYLGAGGSRAQTGSDAALQLARSAEQQLQQLEGSLQLKTLCRVFALQPTAAGGIALLKPDGTAALTLAGQLAHTMLQSCDRAALLLCTLGHGFDSLSRTQQARGMAQAALLDACGSVLVEEACDKAEEALRQQHPGLYLTDRFSPGYGDLPLSLQRDMLTALDATRLSGVYLTDTCLMNPSKTVTAIVGLSHLPQRAKIRGCEHCTLRDTCNLRKDGKRCDTL